MSASDIAIFVPVALRKLIGSRFSTWVAALIIDCCKSDASSEDAVVSIGRRYPMLREGLKLDGILLG